MENQVRIWAGRSQSFELTDKLPNFHSLILVLIA